MQYSLGRSYAIPTTSHHAFNSVKKSAKSKNTVGWGGDGVLSFCGFFFTYSKRKTYEVPTRYRADTGKDSVKSTTKFLIFNNCSGWTHPVSSLIEQSSYRYCEDFACDLPAICRPRKGFFHNFDFETVLPVSKMTAGRNLPVLLRFVLCPTRYGVFCSGKT